MSAGIDLPGPSKKVKVGKRECKYQDDWKHHGIVCSSKGKSFALCNTCGVNINISHGGISDVRKHLATFKHQQLAKATSSCGDLRELIPQSNPIEDTVTRAEILFANFVAEHNLPFATANHFTRLTHAMFSDSKIARAFSCARTKTTCIIKGALHPHFTDPIIQLCKNGPFSILCDEDSDTDDKHLAILVRLWDNDLGAPVTRFLNMPVCNIGTATKLFECIDTTLQERGIPWAHVVGFESDTTNAMVGKHNSVLSRVKEKQPTVYSQGCVCHLANLSLLAGVKSLPVDVDDFFVDLFYFFEKSAKRKEDFREFQHFTDTKQFKIIKHCKTRWLSLEKAVNRVLQQWPALYAYFDYVSENDHSSRVKRLDQNFKSHLTKLVILFLKFALESMCKFNAVFQSSMPMLPALKPEVHRLLRILLGRFLQAEAIQNANDDLAKISLQDPQLQLPDDQLGIGHEAWAYLTAEEDFLDSSAQRIFFNGVRDFYVSVASTIIRKFPFSDTLVDDVAIFIPIHRATLSWNQVSHLAQRFSASVPQSSFDALQEEVLDYKLAPSLTLPTVEQRSTEDSLDGTKLCSYWQEVGRMMTVDGRPRFPHLTCLAKCVLSLPVSNADTERVFSVVRKIVTDYRTEMDQSTLCALLACKLNTNVNCFELDTPKDLIRNAKRATMEYNRQHTSARS